MGGFFGGGGFNEAFILFLILILLVFGIGCLCLGL
jgi:hypothetical protein